VGIEAVKETPEKPVERYERNSCGPFYVEAGACIACGAPERSSPDLIRFRGEENHCYFFKQPTTSEETSRAIRALWANCCGALRYGGTDPDVLRRLADLDLADQCDERVTTPRRLIVRNCATFSFDCGVLGHRSCGKEIERCVSTGLTDEISAIKVRRRHSLCSTVRFGYTWYKDIPGIEVTIRRVSLPGRTWLLSLKGRQPAEVSNAMLVDDILRAEGRFKDIRWYTEYDWLSGGKRWNELPY
jgi:hypothetical protein